MTLDPKFKPELIKLDKRVPDITSFKATTCRSTAKMTRNDVIKAFNYEVDHERLEREEETRRMDALLDAFVL